MTRCLNFANNSSRQHPSQHFGPRSQRRAHPHTWPHKLVWYFTLKSIWLQCHTVAVPGCPASPQLILRHVFLSSRRRMPCATGNSKSGGLHFLHQAPHFSCHHTGSVARQDNLMSRGGRRTRPWCLAECVMYWTLSTLHLKRVCGTASIFFILSYADQHVAWREKNSEYMVAWSASRSWTSAAPLRNRSGGS